MMPLKFCSILIVIVSPSADFSGLLRVFSDLRRCSTTPLRRYVSTRGREGSILLRLSFLGQRALGWGLSPESVLTRDLLQNLTISIVA